MLCKQQKNNQIIVTGLIFFKAIYTRLERIGTVSSKMGLNCPKLGDYLIC